MPRSIKRNPRPGGQPDLDKRLWLASATVMGGAGLIGASIPFVQSLEPSAKARAEGGPVEVEIQTSAPGTLQTVAWRGRPVWLLHRSTEMIAALQKPNPDLADPLSRRSEQPPACVNATRSLRPDLFVAVGICTHLGCSPTLRLDDSALNAELHAPGGFVCPCHGSRFDLAGRVVKNVPAPTNLEVPMYRFTSDKKIVIG
ncbi:MAG TPA: ubiquinol-cytochrome c reductase iron-sulfur subunit [Burkholderiaceae bacterium]|nr:ubiquinol-cytochrome c reductase iron-sulfur subunit [Burkholderiaceae bacterium]